MLNTYLVVINKNALKYRLFTILFIGALTSLVITSTARTPKPALYMRFAPKRDTLLTFERYVQMKTRRLVHTYTFCSLCAPCALYDQTICFYYHDNIENGERFQAVKILTDKELKKIKFTSAADVYAALYQTHSGYYNIFIVKTESGKHYLYNVKVASPIHSE